LKFYILLALLYIKDFGVLTEVKLDGIIDLKLTD
jgi:hypothetical protein